MGASHFSTRPYDWDQYTLTSANGRLESVVHLVPEVRAGNRTIARERVHHARVRRHRERPAQEHRTDDDDLSAQSG